MDNNEALEVRETREAETPAARFVVLSDDDVRNICDRAAEIGAQTAVKHIREERRREISKRTDRRLRNTKMLLRNYHVLKEHAESAVFSRMQMPESALDILESLMSGKDNDVLIKSIENSAERTAIMLSHIDAMIGIFEAYCEKCQNPELERLRFDIMWDMYLSEQTLSVEEIAGKYNISVRGVYNHLKMAIERMSALLFGVDCAS